VGCTSKPLSLPAAATPTEPSGTVIRNDGQNLILSHPQFYWTLTLPQDWIITRDEGFEVEANDPKKTAFVHLVSQQWENETEWLPTAQDYVNYWKNSPLGDVFPVFAEGTQLSETEISQAKFGGPYLRYEFEDAKKRIHYVQVYASGGGPNSLIVSAYAKIDDFLGVKDVLDSILESATLLKAP
jgi:hypothetical protein